LTDGGGDKDEGELHREDLYLACSREVGIWWAEGAAQTMTLRKAIADTVFKWQSCKVKGGSEMEE
jgi:hypothetical protein